MDAQSVENAVVQAAAVVLPGRVRRPLGALGDAARGGALWLALSVPLAAVDRRAAAEGVAAMGVAEAAAQGLKQVTRRRRPASLGRALGRRASTSSFPSSHAALAGAYVTATGWRKPATLAVTLPLATAVGWSRVTSARHFPTDVVAGYLLGAASAAAVHTAPARVAPEGPAAS